MSPRPLRAWAALGLVAAALPGRAFAQASSADLEYLPSELERQKKDLEVKAGFEAEWHEYDNLDLRPLDETSDQSILDSDDRNSFAFTGVRLELGYRIDDKTRFVIAASHRGLWGNDQIGNINAFGGLFYFNSLYVDYSPGGLKEGAVRARIGREYFEIGGLGGARDYVLADVLDQVRLTLKLGGAGRLELVPITVVGASSENDNANFVSFIGQSSAQSFGFRGDHMTRRHGAVLVLDGLAELDARAYAFYTDVGALGSGSDISYNGALGNFSDNDWVANAGVRASYRIAEKITPFASFDVSNGIDRKELVAQDVLTNGWAAMAGLRADTRDDEGTGLEAELSWFRASGAVHDGDNALLYSHGYVGMKAQQVGGTLTNRFMGWHPSAYVGMFGVTHDAHDIDRKAGTQVLHASVGYQLPVGFGAGLSWWTMADTGRTDFNLAQLDALEPPFGYSRNEFAAQERLGTSLGQELNLDLWGDLTEHLQVYANGAVYLPGDYYAIPVDRIAGDALGGQERAWGFSGGTSLRF